MKIVKDRIVVEKIPLRECEAGDTIYFPYGTFVTGGIIIVKIKTIPKGKVQIKYRSGFKWQRNIKLNLDNVIQKVNLPAGTIVERKRKADHRESTPIKECVGEIVR